MAWYEKFTGVLEDKRKWKEHGAWVKSLPEAYRSSFEAMERYVMYAGGINSSSSMMEMVTDLDEMMRQTVADQTPIRGLVGDDPVAFLEAFLDNYRDGQWIEKERRRLTEAIDNAVGSGS